MAVTGTINKCITLINDKFKHNGSTRPLYFDIVNEDNLPLSACYDVTPEVFKTHPIMKEVNNCGCPTLDCNKASLRIKITKKNVEPNECTFKGFTLEVTGLVLFQYENALDSLNISPECCLSLGYESILKDGAYVCKWGDVKDPNYTCEDYVFFSNSTDGFLKFNGPDGITQEVPFAECCPRASGGGGVIPVLQPNGMYKCMF